MPSLGKVLFEWWVLKVSFWPELCFFLGGGVFFGHTPRHVFVISSGKSVSAASISDHYCVVQQQEPRTNKLVHTGALKFRLGVRGNGSPKDGIDIPTVPTYLVPPYSTETSRSGG